MPNDNVSKTILVALGVCLVCSILVSSAAVSLKPVQIDNQRNDRISKILAAGGLSVKAQDIQDIYEKKMKAIMVDLDTGDRVSHKEFNDKLNVETFDIKAMAGSAEYGKDIPPDDDIADILRMPRYMVVYLMREQNRTTKIILPVYGKGLWSTMYGFIALDRDLRTIKGITFYDHGETPGLGGEIDNPRWQQLWEGKQAFDEKGAVTVRIIKGKVTLSSPDAPYQIDGITGATLTVRGVNNTIEFWLGSKGYGPFLRQLGESLDG